MSLNLEKPASENKKKPDYLTFVPVHPVREDAAVKFMLDGGEDEGALRGLETDGHIVRSLFCGHAFYLRKLGR